MFRDLSNYDVFNSWLLEDADYTEGIELPVLKGTDQVPDRLGLYSTAFSTGTNALDFWPCPYEHDKKFVRIWRNPKRYIPILLRYPGVISPDFSMYRNMPAAMQQWACFKGRAIAHRIEHDGGIVVPNVRWADERSFEYCFEGLPKHSTLAVGSHGCIKMREDRRWFMLGLEQLVVRLEPRTLVVYGAAPEDVFSCVRSAGVRIVQFESKFSSSHKAGD